MSKINGLKVGLLMLDDKIEEIGLNQTPTAASFRDLSLHKVELFEQENATFNFDVLLHNMSDFLADGSGLALESSAQHFYDLLTRKYRIVCIDPVDSVLNIFSRYDQLCQAQNCISTSFSPKRIFVPAFCLLNLPDVGTNVRRLEEAGLVFPIICKPIRAQGEGAHNMAVVFNKSGLAEVNYPVVAQQFINHNAKLFKISVIVDHVTVTQRPSIKNMHVSNQKPVFFHSFMVSKDGHNSSLTDLDPGDHLGSIVPKEDAVLFKELAACVRKHFKLDLFSVDVIECVEHMADTKSNSLLADTKNEQWDGPKFAVIDVNPLPSYKNVPHFHHHLGNLIRMKLSLPTIPLSNDSC